MSEFRPTKPYLFDAGKIQLELHRFRNDGKPRVLLLHGASACHHTFLFGRKPGGLARYLHENGFEPWLLDWCGSNRVIDKYQGRGNWKSGRFDFDKAAAVDLPAALEKIEEVDYRDKREDQPMPYVVGFCMGSAVIAQSIAAGHLDGRDIRNVVLMTIGLFYRTTTQGGWKIQDHILDRVMADQGEDDRYIDSRCHTATPQPIHPWPATFETMYGLWPSNFQPHHSHHGDRQRNRRHIYEQCNRVSFMFGQPYEEAQLVPDLHESPEELGTQFGAIPLRMYQQAAQNARRGWAAEIDATTPQETGKLLSNEARRHFAALDRITLITGARNRIWHHDSIDRMHEWLRRPTHRADGQLVKHVLRNYGHQDLLWGKNAENDVYSLIADRLRF